MGCGCVFYFVLFLISVFSFWFVWKVIIWWVVIGIVLFVFGLWFGCCGLLCNWKLLNFDSLMFLLFLSVLWIILKNVLIMFFVLCLFSLMLLNSSFVSFVFVSVGVLVDVGVEVLWFIVLCCVVRRVLNLFEVMLFIFVI